MNEHKFLFCAFQLAGRLVKVAGQTTIAKVFQNNLSKFIAGTSGFQRSRLK